MALQVDDGGCIAQVVKGRQFRGNPAQLVAGDQEFPGERVGEAFAIMVAARHGHHDICVLGVEEGVGHFMGEGEHLPPESHVRIDGNAKACRQVVVEQAGRSVLQVFGERKPPDKDVGLKRLEWVSKRAAPGVEIPTQLSRRPGCLLGACRAGCRERASARPGKRCAYLASKIGIVGQVLLQQAHPGLGSLAERPRRRAVQHPADIQARPRRQPSSCFGFSKAPTESPDYQAVICDAATEVVYRRALVEIHAQVIAGALSADEVRDRERQIPEYIGDLIRAQPAMRPSEGVPSPSECSQSMAEVTAIAVDALRDAKGEAK